MAQYVAQIIEASKYGPEIIIAGATLAEVAENAYSHMAKWNNNAPDFTEYIANEGEEWDEDRTPQNNGELEGYLEYAFDSPYASIMKGVTISVDVNTETGAYTVRLDGRELVEGELELEHPGLVDGNNVPYELEDAMNDLGVFDWVPGTIETYDTAAVLTQTQAALGLSERALADLLDVQQPTLNRWKTGARAPRTDIRYELAQIHYDFQDTVNELQRSGVADESVPWIDAAKYWANEFWETLEKPTDHHDLAVWTLRSLARALRAGEDPSGRFPVSHEGDWAEPGNPVNISTWDDGGTFIVTVDYCAEDDPSDLSSIEDYKILDEEDTQRVRAWVRKELGI